MYAIFLTVLHDKHQFTPYSLIKVFGQCTDQFNNIGDKYVKIEDFYKLLEGDRDHVKCRMWDIENMICRYKKKIGYECWHCCQMCYNCTGGPCLKELRESKKAKEKQDKQICEVDKKKASYFINRRMF